MSLPATYPPANTTAQKRPAGGGTISTVEKLVLHTTETAGWPGYPTFAPHLTYDPWSHRWHQHMPLTRTATTLEDPSSTAVRENRDNAIQVEIIAYCDPRYNVPGKGIDHLDDEAVRDLAELAAWLHPHGLELDLAPGWLPYPQSYGNTRNRMSSDAYDRFRGVLGHEHVSGNHHGDPGAPPWLATFLRYARAAAGGDATSPAPAPAGNKPAAVPEIGPKRMSTDVYVRHGSTAGQPLKPGVDTEVRINDKGDTSIVSKPSAGVDVIAVVDVRDEAGNRVDVELFWRIVSYKKGTTTTVYHSREAAYGNQATFKGALKADSDKTRSRRLRLIARLPKGSPAASIKLLQVQGWKL